MKNLHFVWAAVFAWIATSTGNAYLVGPPQSLEKLAAEADVIFKGTALSEEPIQDQSLQPIQGFAARETTFQVVSLIKGENAGVHFRFRHYDEQSGGEIRMYSPQFYHFEAGQTYIVFAKKCAAAPSVFGQLWLSHNTIHDQGMLLCSDNRPVTTTVIKEVVWKELTVMLGDRHPTNIVYAIRHLKEMSGGKQSLSGVEEFDRREVLKRTVPLMAHGDPDVARAAIVLTGSENPYLSEERAPYWLATVGAGIIPGLAQMNARAKNIGAELFCSNLVAVADDSPRAGVRALAVRALGLLGTPALQKPLDRWLADKEPEVRAAAALLLADFPQRDITAELTGLADDGSAEVRACVAYCVGFGQRVKFVNILAILLRDRDPQVRRAAAMSLLSFSPTNESVRALFHANLLNDEFKPLFLNALARDNPQRYRDELAAAIEAKENPQNWWGGEIPVFTSWKILFKYLQAQPVDRVRSGRLDRYLDAIEKVGNYSSSEPRDIYAFYLQRDLPARAKAFRQSANKSASYDLDYYFKQVDVNPSLYTRD